MRPLSALEPVTGKLTLAARLIGTVVAFTFTLPKPFFVYRLLGAYLEAAEELVGLYTRCGN